MYLKPDRLRSIYDKTEGYCRYCGKKISWINYGNMGERGAWEVDHSIPVSIGGSDHMNNLFPSCIDCNREKSDLTGVQFQRSITTEEETSIGDVLFGVGLAVVGIGILKALLSR